MVFIASAKYRLRTLMYCPRAALLLVDRDGRCCPTHSSPVPVTDCLLSGKLDTRLIASDNTPSISLGAEAYHRSPTVRKQVAQPGNDRLCEWIRLVT